jgi:hypothetical protein
MTLTFTFMVLLMFYLHKYIQESASASEDVVGTGTE